MSNAGSARCVVSSLRLSYLSIWFFAVLTTCAVGAQSGDAPCHDDRLPPELCTPEARSDLGMVATGSPEATETAVEILERGGNAIDAAVAAALTLGVADIDASGLGGVTTMVIHLASGRTLAIDGTTNAPMAIDIEKFREFKKSGRPYGYETVAVPTTLAVLEHARANYGTRDMATLLQPAIDFAERGFELSRIQLLWMRKYGPHIVAASAYMSILAMEDGKTAGNAGDRLCQPDIANTLRRIAADGVQSFYRGSIADEIEADMIQNGGFLRKSDLARVRIRETQPLHTTYRGFDIFTVPPPSGGAAVVLALNILETFPSEFIAEDSVERHHTLIEAFRIAAADAPKASGWHPNPGSDPLGKPHARDRAAFIIPGTTIPEEILAPSLDPECRTEGESTTQVSVADSRGNVVSLTQTLSRSFGSKVATPGLGFPYNSFLEFFNADKPQCSGYLQPNSPCETDMAPTIVLSDGALFTALGTPGSTRIPPLVAGVISNMVDRGMGVRDAVTAPRILWGGTFYGSKPTVELTGPLTEEDIGALQEIGFEDIVVVQYPDPNLAEMADSGGVNAISFDPKTGVFTGVGDPRRYGSAMGPRVVAIHD